MSKPRQEASPVAVDWGSGRQVRVLVLIVATAALVFLCLRMAAPFVPVIAWGLAFAIMLTPFQRWLEKKTKRPGLSASIAVGILVLIVFGLAVFVGGPLVTQFAKSLDVVKEKLASGEWQQFFVSYPKLAVVAQWIAQQNQLPEVAGKAAGWFTGAAGSVFRGSVLQIVGIVLVCYVLFFLLRDRKAALDLLRSLTPLRQDEMDRLLTGVNDTVHATIYGSLTVAAIQGALGGLMFWILGLPAPLLWGIVMMIFALIPVMGTFMVWGPGALFLASQGEWGRAILLVAWGALAVSTIDNVLYPILVGQRLKMHTLFTFFAIVGGLFVFGGSGILLGPITLCVTKLLLDIWKERTRATDPAQTE